MGAGATWPAPFDREYDTSSSPRGASPSQINYRPTKPEDQEYGARPKTRHPVSAHQDRSEDSAQPVLSGPALHRRGFRQAGLSGGASFAEGRRRLGGDQYGILLHSARAGRHASLVGA